MASIDVRDRDGQTIGTVDLPEAWFTGDINVHVMHEVVTAQLAAARQGTHKTKTRSQVRGGGRKPWRQKGTGRARHGSIRSPLWIGGGHAFARVPRDYSKRVNKKTRRLALRSALTDRANQANVAVVRGLAYETPRTKDALRTLTGIGAVDRKVLVVLADNDANTVKSFRNLPLVHTLVVDQLNTYDVLKSDVVLFDEAALDLIGTGRRASNAHASTPGAADQQETEA